MANKPKDERPSLAELVRDVLEKKENSIPRELAPMDKLRYTLLNVPNRAPLPPVPGVRPGANKLVTLVHDFPEEYAQFIVYLEAGAYYHVAAAAIDVSAPSLQKWLKQGREDEDKDLDTYYARLWKDVRKALARCRAGAEQMVREMEPRKWLTLGPGRVFGGEWAESNQTHEPLELESTLQPQLEDKRTESSYSMNAAEELAAIEALEAAGQGTFSEEFKQSLRKRVENSGNVVPDKKAE